MYFKLTLPVSALNKPDGFFTRSEFKTPFSAVDDALHVDGLPCYQGYLLV